MAENSFSDELYVYQPTEVNGRVKYDLIRILWETGFSDKRTFKHK